MRQKTLKEPLFFEGKGLHTGLAVRMRIEPREADFGLVFQREDLPEKPQIPALIDYVADTQRSTNLQKDGVWVRTVEHILSALVGMEVDNCLIVLDNEEVPILDGSAQVIVREIARVGVVELAENKQVFGIREPLSYTDLEQGISISIEPADTHSVTALLDFNSKVFSAQYATFSNFSQYSEEIAPARTFGFLKELRGLLDKKLIQGGNLHNALVIVDEELSAEQLEELRQRVGFSEKISVNMGILSAEPARFANEPARHKILDIIGDLALVGFNFRGKIYAQKTGHKANIELAKKIRASILKNREVWVPRFDPNVPPLLDTVEIMRRLPHRHPFLLVDKILEMDAEHIVGLKNITFDEGFFLGHFPGNPVMPGVLQIEAMAQTGGILVLSYCEDPHNYDTYFLKIENAKFKRKIVPGDTMLLSLYLLEPIRRGICRMSAKIFVGGQVCTEAVLVAQIVKSRNDSSANL